MTIDENILKEELAVLKADFDKTNKQIQQVEKDLGTMRSNLNAVYGAIQQTEKFLEMIKKEKPDGKKI